jgi:protein PhnA
MKFQKELELRANEMCEFSGSTERLTPFLVSPNAGNSSDDYVLISEKLKLQLDSSDFQINDWHCLNDTVWSETPAVKVLSYRVLSMLQGETWPSELKDMMYLSEEELTWAKAGLPDENAIKHIDSNGVMLQNGDSVVLIKDLDVKGSSLVAKRGTSVRNIRLVHDDPNLLEGKVDGQSIYILTQFVKK